MTTSDAKDSNNKENAQTEDSASSTTKGSASAKKASGRPDFVYDVRDRESFYKDLQTFHESRNTPIARFPKVNGKEIDLHKLYAEVVKRGGWLKVNIRNEWDELQHVLGIQQKCVNATVALKYIYTRFLDKYERLHFLGEDPDRADEPDDEGRHKKWSSKTFHSVAMTYNHNQHQVAEPLRILHRMSTDMYKPTEYDKLLLSLLSPLPNEQDFAINVCTLMANESQHTLKLDHCPKLIEALIAHAGVFSHFTLRDLFTEMYSKTRRHSLQTFWSDCLHDKPPILELSYDDFFQAPDEKFTDSATRSCEQVVGRTEGGKMVDPEEYKSDVGKFDFLCLGRGLGTHDYVGQRVLQVTSIMRNLSFFEENLPYLSTNRTFLRYLVMCSNIRWGNLHHMALDIFGNIAMQVNLRDPPSDELTRCILTTLCEGLEGQDRGVIISCLEILNKLSLKDANAASLNKCLDFKTYNQICLFLALNDIMLLLYTLECLYGLSSLGPRPCNSIIQVKGVVDTLVSLITVEAQSYGPDGCILMRVVETVPGNMLPMVAQNIANLQNVAMQGHVLASKKDSLSEGLHGAHTIVEPQKIIVPNPVASTPVRAVLTQVSKESISPQTVAVAKNLNHVQDSDPFALAWVTATFEMVASSNSRVEQQELYKMYLAACQKAGRRGVVSPIHFPQIVRNVLGANVGPSLIKTTETNGVELNAFYYINIRVRANPMPVQYKTPSVQVHPTTTPTAAQKIGSKAPPQSPVVQHQVKIIQTPVEAAAIEKSKANQKGKTPKKLCPQPQPVQGQQTVQQVQQQPQIVTQLQENQLVAGKHVIISHSVTSQPVVQKNVSQQSNQGESNQMSVIQQSTAQQPQIQIQQQNIVQPQQIQMQQQQIQLQPQQQMQLQQQPQPMQIAAQQQQVQMQAATQQVQIQQQQISQVIQNPNSAAMIHGNGGMPQTSSSLIKSLLANKVTTSPTATSDVSEANASAAANNPSCLITQNVNLHQVVQRQQMKQKELAQQQLQQQQLQQQQQLHQQQQLYHHHQQQQQQNVTHATISSLVNNPIIPTNAVKVGQTTIKAITTNAVLPASVMEKKPSQSFAPPNAPQANVDTPENSNSHWDPVPPLAPLSGNMQQNMKNQGNAMMATGNDDSNSTGNNSVASSAMSSTQILTTDDGEGSLISFEGLLVPKSKSESSSVTEDDASKDSFNRHNQIFQGNQMLVDLLDKKSPDPPAPSAGMKRKYDEETAVETGNQKRPAMENPIEDLDDEEDMPMVQASKNAANLYAEMAASILEDEDLDEEPEMETTIPVIQPPVEQKQVITMPVPIQRQIIMGPNNQVILTQPAQTVNQPVPQQATATIKTDSGLQTVPLIIQKQIGPNGQQIIQPVMQHQQQTQTQYMLATNPQGQTYLVAQQQPSQQPINPALLLAQAGQQQGSQTKTIIILQQQGGPPQAVAQQQIISNQTGQQKVIMTTQQGQQMIVTQVPRPVHHHQIIVNNPNTNMMQNVTSQSIMYSQNAPIVQQSTMQHHQHYGAPQPQIQIQPMQGGQQQIHMQGAGPQQQIQIQASPMPQGQIQIQPASMQQQQQIQIQSPHSVIQKQMHITQPVGGASMHMVNQTQQNQHSMAMQGTVVQQNQAALQAQANQQQMMQSQAAQQHASILSQLPQIPATIKIHSSVLQNQAQQQQTTPKTQPKSQVSITQQTMPSQTPVQQQSVIQAPQQRADVKRQIIMSGSGAVELSENSKRVATPTPTQPINVAQASPQGSQQTQQQTQPPVAQSPVPQIQQTPHHSAIGRVAKSNPDTSASEDDCADHNWLWICDWRGCPRKQYKSLADVYRHACTVHCPESLDPAAEIYCQWGPGSGLCDNIPRKRYSLMTHLLDRHCTVESFKAAVQRRLTTGVQPPTHGQPVTIIKNVPSNSSDTRGTASPALSTSSSGSLPPAASAAMHAIKRHSNDFVNPKELMDENEGPVTKSIRLTAALILRNLVTHTSLAKRNIRCYEPHLAGVALSNVESSRTISQILYELNN